LASLHASGWRQGSVFVATLPLDAVVLGADGTPERRQSFHDRWVVASQNCDLDTTDEDSPDPTIEIRPAYTHSPPADWGIRSSRLLLAEGEYVESTSPRTTVAAEVLTALLEGGIERRDPQPDRELAFTTWLGLRYDRPAVPPALVPLAKRIADEVVRPRNRENARRVRDVLMQFDETVEPLRYSLYGVLVLPEDRDAVREWLATVAAAVPVELGVADIIEAAPTTEISFDVIETSYPADVSQMTWRASQPEQDGASG
jgi:hypothetical protein